MFDVLQQLRDAGISKWRIAKEIDVSWNTVHMWSKGMFSPSIENKSKLKNLLLRKMKNEK